MFKGLLIVSFASAISVASGALFQDPVPAAQAPAATTSTLKNPVKATAESQAKAKKTFGYDCAMCHGDSGNGKSDLAASMKLTLTDWTAPGALASESDGDLFEIIRKGKDKMPPEEANRAKDEDVWNLVIYVRSLAKGGNQTASAKH
jgi:mono/diheme cytochrome c family protein